MGRIKTVMRLLLVFSVALGGLFASETSFAEPIGIVSDIEIFDTEGLFNEENISLDKLETQIGMMAHTSAVERDMQALYDSGYFVKVSGYAKQRGDGVAIVFEVQSNPVLRQIILEGTLPEHEASIRSLLNTQTGTVFNRNILAEDAKLVNEWFAEQGYPAGRIVSYRLSSSGILYLMLNSGIVGDVTVVTNTGKHVADLRNTIQIQEGDILTDHIIGQSVEQLSQQPSVSRVSDVRLTREADSGFTHVTFVVEEERTGRYEVGVGYNTNDGFLAYGNISEQRLFDTNRSLAAGFRLSQRNSIFDVQYSDSVFCSQCWERWNLNVYRRYGVFGRNQEYEETTLGVTTSIDKKIATWTLANIGATYNYVHDGADARRLVALEGALQYNNEHLLLRGDTTYALPALGSDYQYVRTLGTFGLKQEFGPGKLSAIFQYGHLQGNFIPQSAYFRVGGPGTLRGYPFSWKRGERFLTTSVEYVVRVWGIAGVGVFVDIADAVDIGERFSPQTSAGLGIRVDTPIGLLKLDYASGEKGDMRLVFGVGTGW